MKGQMYVTVVILMIVALFALKIGTTGFTSPMEPDINNVYKNVKNEMIDLIELSLLNGEDLSNNLDSFVSFTTEILESRGYSQEITYEIDGYNTKVNLYLEYNGNFINDTFVVNKRLY